MKRLLLVVVFFASALCQAAVIKTDTFTITGGNSDLSVHTSDVGGAWQGTNDSQFTVLDATDDVQDSNAGVRTVIGDENPTETDYFQECNMTIGGTASTDRVGVLGRAGFDLLYVSHVGRHWLVIVPS